MSVTPDEVTWNALLEAYVKGADVDGARAVMEEMRAAGVNPNEVTWKTLLKLYVGLGVM